MFCLCENYRKIAKKKVRHKSDLLSYFAFWVRFSQCFVSMSSHPCLDINCLFLLDKHVIIINGMLRYGPVLLMCGLWKNEFRENFGAILDFPGIPNKGKS